MKTRIQTILEKVSEIIEGKMVQNVPLYPDPKGGSSQWTRSDEAFGLRFNRGTMKHLSNTPEGRELARFYAGQIKKGKEKVRGEEGRGRVERPTEKPAETGTPTRGPVKDWSYVNIQHGGIP